MNNLHYYSPENLSDALGYLADHPEVKVLAGGTDLIAKWKKTGFPDMTLLDTGRIKDFSEIKELESGLFIGAGATMEQVQYDEKILKYFPILAEAASKVGSVQIRNRATIGGNCCNAAPSADTVLPLLVYEAEVMIVSQNSEKRCPLDKFFVGPGKTILQKGELVSGFVLPFHATEGGASFVKHSRRPGMDLATIGAAIRLECFTNEKKIKKLAIALGAVGPTPILVKSLAQFHGIDASLEENISAIAKYAASCATPITDVRGSMEYRKEMLEERIADSLRAALNK
ncbi:MAG: FAD binding domain-containing protein [Cloacibacillus sp.]